MLISTHMSEIGEEQFSGRFFDGGLTDVSYSPGLRQAVAAGPTSIKVSPQDSCRRMHSMRRVLLRDIIIENEDDSSIARSFTK